MAEGMALTSPVDAPTGYLLQCFEVTPTASGNTEIEHSFESLMRLLQETRLVAVMLDIYGTIQFSNTGLCRLLGLAPIDIVNSKLFLDYAADADHSLYSNLYPDGVQDIRFPTEFQSELRTPSGQICHVFWHAIMWRDAAGQVKGTVLIGDDVTALHMEESRTALFAKAFDATEHSIIVTNAQGTILSVNRAFTALTGYSSDEAVGRNPRLLQSGRHDEAFYKKMWETVLRQGHWAGDVWDRHKDGNIYCNYLSISAIKEGTVVPTHYVGISFNNSERKTFEERLDRLAHYDGLTGLPNRGLLVERLEQAVERAHRASTKVAMLFIDMDHFKEVNDVFGHAAGDALLVEVARRMKACVRAVDTIARVGGDEFVALIPDVTDAADLVIVASKLVETLAQPYPISLERFAHSAPSIGVSIYPDDCANIDDLMRNADAAMYVAKQSGRGTFKFYQTRPSFDS